MAGTNLIAGLCVFLFFFAVATVKLERKSGLLTLCGDGELLGASVCEWAASTLQLLKDTTGTDGHQKNSQTQNPLNPVQHIRVHWYLVVRECKSQTCFIKLVLSCVSCSTCRSNDRVLRLYTIKLLFSEIKQKQSCPLHPCQ